MADNIEKMLEITRKTQEISEEILEEITNIIDNNISQNYINLRYENDCQKIRIKSLEIITKDYYNLQDENNIQKERIKSLENINTQNEFLIQELREHFIQEIKNKKKSKF